MPLGTLWVMRRVPRDSDSRRKVCLTLFPVLLPLSTIPSVDADPCGLLDLWLGVADLVPVRTGPLADPKLLSFGARGPFRSQGAGFQAL